MINKKQFLLIGLQLFILLATSFVQAAGHVKNKQVISTACKDITALPNLRCASAPSVGFDEKGILWVTWFYAGHIYVSRSDDKGQTFNSPVAVNRIPENVYAKGENRPKIAFGAKGELYLSWTKKRTERRFSGDIRFSRSIDGGRHFSEPLTVNDDHEITSHRFDALAVNRQGDIYIAWLDKRDLLAAKKVGKLYTGAALYYALSTDNGKTFEKNKKIADSSCQCCRVAIAIDDKQLPVIVWRHIFGDNIRDHAIVKFSKPNQAEKFKRLSHDNWHIEGCPHHGPAISIADDGVYHATWFNNAPQAHGLFYAYSTDNADSFSTPLNIGNYTKAAAHAHVLSLGQRVFIVWKEFDGKQSLVYLIQSNDAGKSWSKPKQWAASSATSDHPFLTHDGSVVYVSWHRRGESYRLLRVSD